MQLEKGNQKYIIIGALSLIALTGVFFGGRALLRAVGILDSAEDKEAKKLVEKARKNPAWSTTYYTSHEDNSETGLYYGGFKATTGDAIVTLIDGSVKNLPNYFGNPITGLWDIFFGKSDGTYAQTGLSAIKNKAQLSYVSSKYTEKYGKDLLTEIADKFESKGIIKILTAIQNIK